MQKHGSQKRASGDPYIAHPLEVAAILTDLKLDDATIAVALLHDTIEDTDATRAEIDQTFGPEIGAIVDGLTKIDRLNLVTREEAQAENLRKLLLAIADDVRVLLVKLADRLHNMRTLEYMAPEKQRRIAQETLDIYAPLAGRMGMQDMRSELEDIAFKTLQPEQYRAIVNRLSEIQVNDSAVIAEIRNDLEQKLLDEGMEATVSARVKSPYSIFSKIERKSIALEQLSDMIGFRVIVSTVPECYRTLGVVHSRWQVVPGKFKDYISVPQAQRLPLVAHHHRRPRTPARRTADPHRGDAPRRRVRDRRARALQGRHRHRPAQAGRGKPRVSSGCAPPSPS